MTQFLIAVFGLAALYMATGTNPQLRKWAPVVGLCGQPAWVFFAFDVGAGGLLVLSLAYTSVYARGCWVQWRVAA